MRPASLATILLAAMFCALPLPAQTAAAPQTVTQTVIKTDAATTGPTDEKARRVWDQAEQEQKKHQFTFALDDYRKADKLDNYHCVDCKLHAWKDALELQDYKRARDVAATYLANSTTDADKAHAHYMSGQAWMDDALVSRRDELNKSAETEFHQATELVPDLALYHYSDGMALAYLKRDDEARTQFEAFLKLAPTKQSAEIDRAKRYATRPELVRLHLAPNFRVTTLDGKTLSLDDLNGKVVLLDFWATWCGPCREALPTIQKLAQKFQNEPLVILSISLDKDDAAWKKFVAENKMTWAQYRDGYFDGHIATLFGVKAIPATFTIDTDGIITSTHVGDASLDGTLKKMLANAHKAAGEASRSGQLTPNHGSPSRLALAATNH